MCPETLAEIAQHKNIVAIKEASGNIRQVEDMARLCPDIDIYSGDDFIVLPLLASGGKGVISVVSNIAPKQMHDLVESFMSGDINTARELQYKLNPLSEALFLEVNPIPLKSAMDILGMHPGKLRLPLYEMSARKKEYLTKAMRDFGFNV
jgi:4-hydroxy-tetrahydrodipicolinate synthase